MSGDSNRLGWLQAELLDPLNPAFVLPCQPPQGHCFAGQQAASKLGGGAGLFPYLILLSAYLILTSAQDAACHPPDQDPLAQTGSRLALNPMAHQGRAKVTPRPPGLQAQ